MKIEECEILLTWYGFTRSSPNNLQCMHPPLKLPPVSPACIKANTPRQYSF